MEAQTSGVEPVTLGDILSLATWSRERSTDELRTFIEARHGALETIDDADLDLGL